MSHYIVDGAELIAIGNAIRARTNTSFGMTLPAMATAISEITGGTSLSTSNSIALCIYGNATSVSRSSFSLTQKSLVETICLPNCTSVGNRAFTSDDGYYNLRSVDLPACQTIGQYAFSSCGRLESVSAPMCATVDYDAFIRCSSLRVVSLPACTSLGSRAFLECSNLVSVHLPSCLVVGESTFDECTSLRTVSMPVCKSLYSGAFNECTSLSEVYLPSCEYVSDFAFRSCHSLSLVSLPTCSYLGMMPFYECSSLSSVYLLSSGVVSVYPMYYSELFSDTNTLTLRVYVPSGMLPDYLATDWSYWYINLYDMNGEWGGDYYEPTTSGGTSSSHYGT